MKLATTTDGVIHAQRAAIAPETVKLPIRHFIVLLMCRKEAVDLDAVYKRLCKERLVQFTYESFCHDIKVMERKGWIKQCQ